jgi:hypothetical protein
MCMRLVSRLSVVIVDPDSDCAMKLRGEEWEEGRYLEKEKVIFVIIRILA